MVATHRRVAWLPLLALALLLLVPPAPTLQANEPVAAPFAAYYWQHHGPLVLGNINTPLQEQHGYQVQYFEKGRLENHQHETSAPAHSVTYSRLTVEMIEQAPGLPIDGMPITYGELATRGQQQHAPPTGFAGGTMRVEQGIFIPAVPDLSVAPGYIVPFQFWTYINRSYLFPGGWMHDIGLPLTNAFDLLVPTSDGSSRRIVMQAFERTILLLDLTERYGWPVTRANIGTDALWAQGIPPLAQAPVASPPRASAGDKRIEVNLAEQWLYAYEGDQLVMDVPVSTGKDGFETPPGSFAIYSKIRSKTLRGSYNGESWSVPDVPYIMFYRGGFAIHGVYWHDRFGTGERYSHGCVGVAPYDAEALYQWAPGGTPVIVY